LYQRGGGRKAPSRMIQGEEIKKER